MDVPVDVLGFRGFEREIDERFKALLTSSDKPVASCGPQKIMGDSLLQGSTSESSDGEAHRLSVSKLRVVFGAFSSPEMGVSMG